jgi:hypothetical protein
MHGATRCGVERTGGAVISVLRTPLIDQTSAEAVESTPIRASPAPPAPAAPRFSLIDQEAMCSDDEGYDAEDEEATDYDREFISAQLSQELPDLDGEYTRSQDRRAAEAAELEVLASASEVVLPSQLKRRRVSTFNFSVTSYGGLEDVSDESAAEEELPELVDVPPTPATPGGIQAYFGAV